MHTYIFNRNYTNNVLIPYLTHCHFRFTNTLMHMHTDTDTHTDTHSLKHKIISTSTKVFT
jgi:hypothetical protein